MPTVRLFKGMAVPSLFVDPLTSVRRRLASSPGSAVPSGTDVQTPLPGLPGLSQAASLFGLAGVSCGHGSGIAGSLNGLGSPAVQRKSAVPSSVMARAEMVSDPTDT